MLPVAGRLDPVCDARQRQPDERPKLGWSDYAEVLREPDTLWFSFLYSLTFGGFVGFTSFLTTFFHEQYQRVAGERRRFHDHRGGVGQLVAPGRWLAIGSDRRIPICCSRCWPPSRSAWARRDTAAACRRRAAALCRRRLLGMGNGAVFQLVPQRFAGRMGIITGVVGAAGGLGGFFLPSMLGAAKDATGATPRG